MLVWRSNQWAIRRSDESRLGILRCTICFTCVCVFVLWEGRGAQGTGTRRVINILIPSRQNLTSATGDHHPAAQQNEIRNTQTIPVDIQNIIELPETRCAPSVNIIEPVPPNPEQVEKRRASPTVQFEPTIDHSDAGSLTTQAPQMNSVHATINALSAWISAVQPRESWYLAGWIEDSPIEFSSRPGRGRQRTITEMLRKSGRRRLDKHTTHRVGFRIGSR